ncbi:MAG: O-antigen ligase family protein, partial [Bacteriovoracia bacterium]
NKIFRKTAFSLIGLVAIFVAGIFIFKNTDLIQNNVALKRITTISVSEGTAQARINNWKMATEGFKERPILGWGQSNFNYVFDKHYLPEHHGNETWFDRVHNILFDWLIAGGIFGLLFYVSIWVASLFHLWKASLGRISINEKAVLVGMLGGYFVHNLFVFDQVVSYMYWIFILSFIYSQSQQKELSFFRKELSEKAKQILIVIICFAIPISMYLINYPSYAANKDLIDGMKITKTNTNGQTTFNYENGIYGNIETFKTALNRGSFANPEIRERILLTTNEISRIENLSQEMRQDYLEFAINEMENQIEEFPNNSRYRYLFGIFFAQIGQFELAEKYLLEAIELSPTKQAIRTPLMKVYAMSDQPEKAIALARETYELDKDKKDLWREYVNLVIKLDPKSFEGVIDETIESGKQEWVEELLKNQIENNPDSFQNRTALVLYYKKVGDIESSEEVLNQALEDFPQNTIQLQSLKEYIETDDNSDNASVEFIN